MFKSWRSDKKKIKAVFKLQFQATQVPRLKKSALMISLVPEDVGKPTFKLEKAAIQDGTCSWENPIYVSVKLIWEPKTGKFKEKIYHFVVSTGSSKSGFLGEASIDFADFAVESEPFTVLLPLKFANSGAVLHVTIQNMQGASHQRYNEENGGLTLQNDGSLRHQESNYDTDENNQNFAEEGWQNMTTLQYDEQNVRFRESMSFDATLASCWGNDFEPNTEQDLGLKKSTVHKDPTDLHRPHRQNSMPARGTVDVITTKKHGHKRSTTDLSTGSASDGSFITSTNSADDSFPRGWQEDSDDSVEKLRSEIAILIRQTEVSELELQSLRKQVMKENKRTEDLSKEISCLKGERDALHAECEQLKLQKRIDDAETESQLQPVNKDSRTLLEEIMEELNCEKDLNTNLRLQLGKTQDSNSNLILAVRDLNEMLEEKNRQISSLTSKLEASNTFEEVQGISSNSNMKADEHKLAQKGVAKEPNDAEEIDMLKQTITNLYGEIEFYRKHKEELEMQLKQLRQDYEILKLEHHNISSKLEQQELAEIQNECSDHLGIIEELESQVQILEDKIKQQSQESSKSLIAINELENQVKGLKKELEEQAQVFKYDLDVMICAKTEQEQRAIRAEEALRKTRWKNSEKAEQLQEEFKRLSAEMAAKLDDNEKLAMKAVTEANELRMEKRNLEEKLQETHRELEQIKDQSRVKLEELSNQVGLKTKNLEQMSLELKNKSDELEYARDRGEERHEAFLTEIQMLRTEIEKLTEERIGFFEQAEENAKLRDQIEHMKAETGETEKMIQRRNNERDDWETKFDSAEKEAKTVQEQLNAIRSLKDENDIMIRNLKSEIKNLSLYNNELKTSLIEEEMERERLRKQVIQLKGELQRKEENIVCTENKKKTAVPPMMALARKEEARSDKKPKVSTSSTNTEGSSAKLLDELKILKERNKLMESELREMQERYSEISLKFAEVEGERQQLVMTVKNLKNGKKN